VLHNFCGPQPNYPEAARRALLEMHRQLGPLAFDERGLALRAVLIRHLVMPGLVEETRQILKWIAEELGPDTYVINLMDQYSPAGRVGRSDYPEINRRITSKEYEAALETTSAVGLRRLDHRAPQRCPAACH